jgi:xanthine/uracil permease
MEYVSIFHGWMPTTVSGLVSMAIFGIVVWTGMVVYGITYLDQLVSFTYRVVVLVLGILDDLVDLVDRLAPKRQGPARWTWEV